MKEYAWKTNERVYEHGISLEVHISFIKSESGKTMQPLQFHIQTPSGCFSTDYIFVMNTTTLQDIMEEMLEYYGD